ncbi:MAG: tetratricopeptide repeat protein, partial [Arenicellales bacterium]|nr:tetratricopeptide repeat protein [Arenicellales bacterium]
LPVTELVAAGEKVSNAAMAFQDLDPEALQRGVMGPMNEENIMALVTAIKEIAQLSDGFGLTLNDIRWTTDAQSGSLGKVVFSVRDGFWLPEFSIERISIPSADGEMAVQVKTVRFELAGSFSSRLSALFEIVGLALRPGETALHTTREFFRMLDREAVMVDFGTQLISTVEPEGILTEINFAFGVPELMGLKFELASRSPTNPIAFLGSSKFSDLPREEKQAAMQKIMTQGQLEHAQLTLTNWNVVDIVLKALADQSGQSEEQLRTTAEMMINMFVGRGTPALAEVSDALAAFLKTPGTLQASFRPPKPLPAADTPEFNALVANPAALIEALGLSVKFLDEPMSIESHRLTQTEGLTASKNAGISANGMPKALSPIPDSNVSDWLSARRAYADEDYETVLRLMVTHAEAGTESAQRVVAHAYRKTDQFEQAVAWYQGLAEKGDAASQFYLGMLYQKGLGVEQDNQVALEWLEKAAAQGDARAIHALALSTQTIEVVTQINSGLSARAQEVLTDVVRHYYEADDPSGIHFAGKSDVLIPTALWDRIMARWRTEGVMPSHVILQAVAGEDVSDGLATRAQR